MFSKALLTVAAVIATVRACDDASALGTNPMTAPSATNWPTIGQPFTVEWSTDYPNKSPEVTLSLYQITGSCPGSACVELADIAGFYANNGSFTWTPSSSLQPGNNYALLFINEDPCLTVWGAAFGLNAAGSSGGSASGLAPAAAALVTSEGAAPAASTGAQTAAGSSVAAQSPAAVSSAAAQSGGGGSTSYTTVTAMVTLTTYYSPGAAGTAAASDVSVDTVTVTDTTTVYETSGFSLGATTTAS